MDVVHGAVDRIDDPDEIGRRATILLADHGIAEAVSRCVGGSMLPPRDRPSWHNPLGLWPRARRASAAERRGEGAGFTGEFDGELVTGGQAPPIAKSCPGPPAKATGRMGQNVTFTSSPSENGADTLVSTTKQFSGQSADGHIIFHVIAAIHRAPDDATRSAALVRIA